MVHSIKIKSSNYGTSGAEVEIYAKIKTKSLTLSENNSEKRQLQDILFKVLLEKSYVSDIKIIK